MAQHPHDGEELERELDKREEQREAPSPRTEERPIRVFFLDRTRLVEKPWRPSDGGAE